MYSFEIEPAELGDRLFVPLYRARHVMSHLEGSGRTVVAALGDCTHPSSGTYVHGYEAGGLMYLRVDNVREFQCNLNREDIERVSPASRGLTPRVIVQQGDVLIARTGTLGKAALSTKQIKGAVMSQHVTRLTPNDPAVLYPGYLAAFLNCDLGKYQLIYSGYGSTRQELTHSALRAVKVSMADPTLRKRVHQLVTAGLRDIYRAVEEYDQALEQFEDLMAVPWGSFPAEDVFTVQPDSLGGMWTPRFHRPKYVALVGWLRREYRCDTVGVAAHVERGKGTHVSQYATKGIPFIRTTGLINYGIDPFPEHYATEDIRDLFQQPVGERDILFSIEGKIGQVAYLTGADECVFKNHIELVRCRDAYDPMWVFLALSSSLGKSQADMYTVVQATIPGMANRLRDVLVPIEPTGASLRQRFEERKKQVTALGYAAARNRARGVRKLRDASRILEHALEALSSA